MNELKPEVPKDATVRYLPPQSDDFDELKVFEYGGEEYSNAYIEAENFENMLGFTLEDVTEWLDNRYETDFSSLEFDSYEYDDGWIILSREVD